jgi:hypothetical protein
LNANFFVACQGIPEPSSKKSATKLANLIQATHFNPVTQTQFSYYAPFYTSGL